MVVEPEDVDMAMTPIQEADPMETSGRRHALQKSPVPSMPLNATPSDKDGMPQATIIGDGSSESMQMDMNSALPPVFPSQERRSSISTVTSSHYEPQEQEVAQLLTDLRETIVPKSSRDNTPMSTATSPSVFSMGMSPAAASTVSPQSSMAAVFPKFKEAVDHRTFISRVSKLPVVNATFKTLGDYYETSKNSSSVLRYSAETVESSVKTLIDNTKPVLSRLEPNLGRLDEFAQRQLDRLERTYPQILSESPGSVRRRTPGAPIASSPALEPIALAVDGQTPVQPNPGMIARWNSYLSAESMRSLKYCLEWLQYASQHVDHQIQIMKDGIARAMNEASTSGTPSSALASLLTLAATVKREVVETLRKVVEVMSKYAGAALPIEARNAASINHALSAKAAAEGNGPEQEAERVLSLANESSSVLRSTTAVVSQSVVAAEYCFGRLPPQNTDYSNVHTTIDRDDHYMDHDS